MDIASYIRSALGAEPSSLFDGLLSDWNAITESGKTWCVVALCPGREQAERLRRYLPDALRICGAALREKGIGMETAGAGKETAYLILTAERKNALTQRERLRLANALGVLLDREYGTETRIGCSGVGQGIRYLPFLRAEAIRTLSRYTVSRTVDKILDYVALNYSDPDLSNEQIARDTFLNYSYLCTKFREEMGMTLGQYILEYRMKTASELLTLPNRNVLEVAGTVGFTDQKQFARCFKRTFGETPVQYCRKIKKRR